MTPLPRLIVITDWSLPRDVLLAKLDAALSAGPKVAVQHRHPEAPTRAFLDEARELKALCDRHGSMLFINGRLDVALLLGAHLHVPADGLLPQDARSVLPAGRLISIAVHSVQEAGAARRADLALVSPVFRPLSKVDYRVPLGPGGFAALASVLPCPAFALGGVTPGNARLVPSAAGFAAIGAVLHSEDPRRSAEALSARQE